MIDTSNLVDSKKKTVSPRVFADPDIYRAEQERIFSRCWLYLGHESQLPEPGSFLTGYMGEEPVLLCRDSRGAIRVFLNSCRHRGMKVCRLDQGVARSFQCPYHGWTYNTQGDLIGVPDFAKAYYEELKREDWGLLEVPQVGVYRGLIFGCFDKNAESLSEYLGEAKWYLDMIFGRTEGGMTVMPGTHKWSLKGNWKLAAEQFGGDNYHTMFTHRSAVSLELADQFGGDQPWTRDIEVKTAQGHNFINFAFDNSRVMSEAAGAFEARVKREAATRLTPAQADLVGCVQVGTIFPNFSLLGFLGFLTIRVWHPRGPGHMEVWSWSIVERAAPTDVAASQRDMLIRTFSPSGIFEQDDSEMWGIATQVAGGYYRSQFPLNYQMGAGHERLDPERPGLIHPPPTEIGVFGFYERWLTAMQREESNPR